GTEGEGGSHRGATEPRGRTAIESVQYNQRRKRVPDQAKTPRSRCLKSTSEHQSYLRVVVGSICVTRRAGTYAAIAAAASGTSAPAKKARPSKVLMKNRREPAKEALQQVRALSRVF